MDKSLIDVRLRQVRLEAEGIASYEFVSATDAALPAFSAGAHIDLHLPHDMIRSYSLVNSPSDAGRYLIAVHRAREGRGGSAWLHSTPRVGDTMRMSAPSNDFPLAEQAARSIFIAGGIGITPIMSMLRQLDEAGGSWHLHYASRQPSTTAFVEELRGMEHVAGKIDFCFGSSRAARLDIDAIVRGAPADCHLYCCGPGRMIDAFIATCKSRPPSSVHFERFSATRQAAVDGGFDIVLSRKGRRLAVHPGMTILDTLLEHAIDVPYACTAGVCGTCRTGVLDGEPEHRDDFLSAEEKRANRSVMICCSGSRSKTLVLDL